MEDAGLEDFFAKKDKKKKKGKSFKIIAADLLPPPAATPPNEPEDSVSEQLAEVRLDTADQDAAAKDKKKQRKKRDKDGPDSSSKNEEDEWNAVQDEVDYSGLRISAKNIAKDVGTSAADKGDHRQSAEDAADNQSEPEYDEEGQLIEKAGDGSVWKVPTPAPRPATPPEEVPAPQPAVAELPNVSEGKYVPPSLRGGAATANLAPVSLKRPTRKKVAPNMESREDFPTLGSAAPVLDYDVSKFEKVRGGGSGVQQSQAGQNRVQTSNMYSALQRN